MFKHLFDFLALWGENSVPLDPPRKYTTMHDVSYGFFGGLEVAVKSSKRRIRGQKS